MRNYSFRINLKLQAQSDDEAKRICELFSKELPKMENVSIESESIYSFNDKRVIKEN